MTADQTFKPGDRVQILDRDREPSNYPYATVVAAETRGPDRSGYERRGYVIRYDNDCEVWIREYDVLTPR